MHRELRITATAIAVALAAVWSSATAAKADQPPRVRAGRQLYQEHCMVCHGPKGKGDGIFADVLRIPPSDLTEIAKRRNGTFPDVEVHEVIDGRRVLPAHGSKEMPIWGRRLGGLFPDSANESAIRAKVDSLVDYLRSIQTSMPPTVGQR
jgi:mono/diheme cytochrome c family protein